MIGSGPNSGVLLVGCLLSAGTDRIFHTAYIEDLPKENQMETEDAIKFAVGAFVMGYALSNIRNAKKIIALRIRNNHNMEVANLKIEAQAQFIKDVGSGVNPDIALRNVLAAKDFIDLIEKSI